MLCTGLQELSAQTPTVYFYPKNYVTLEEANQICAENDWQVATPFQLKEAWVELDYEQYAFGLLSDGRFAVPVQNDYPNFKKDPNVGATGGNQGFFYVKKKELNIEKVDLNAPEHRALLSDVFTDVNESLKEKDDDYNFDIIIQNSGWYVLRMEYWTIPKEGAYGYNGPFINNKDQLLLGQKKRYTWSYSSNPNLVGGTIRGYVITGNVSNPEILLFDVPYNEQKIRIETHGTVFNPTFETK